MKSIKTVSYNKNDRESTDLTFALQQVYHQMVRLRMYEEKIIGLYPEQEMKTPVHLGIGQEAVAVGCISGLMDEDYVYSNHRGHLHYLAKGGDPLAFASELYGKETGCARGRGGSMHLVDATVGLMGSTAIVSGGVPIATGAALGFKMKGKRSVAMVFFGDGAMDEGVIYECFAFASLKKLPVIFVVENNSYATSSHVSKRQPMDNIWERGTVFGVDGYRVDGNDVTQVLDVAQACIEKARNGSGPSLIECVTYRWKGHVGIHEDTGYRDAREIEDWKTRCPIRVMEERYGIRGDQAEIQRIRDEIDRVFAEARAAKDPEPGNLMDYTYWEGA